MKRVLGRSLKTHFVGTNAVLAKTIQKERERITMTTSIYIELSENEREKLERVAELYSDFGFDTEQVARLLLFDAVRAKYSTLPAEPEPYTEEQKQEDEKAYFEAFGYALAGDGEEAELVDLAEL